MSVDPVIAGGLSVPVEGDTTGFAADLRRKIAAETKTLRAKIRAEVDARGLKTQVQAAVKEAQTRAVIKVRMDLDTKGFKSKVDAAVREAQTRATVKVKVDADTTAAGAKVKAIGAQQETVKVKVDVDAAVAEAKVKAIGAQREKVSVKVDADTAAAEAKIRRVKAEASKKTTSIFGFDISNKASRELSKISGLATLVVYGLAAIEGAGSGLVGLVGILGDVVAGLFSIVAAAGPAAGAIALIPAALAAGVQVIGSAIAGFSGIGDAVKALGKTQQGGAKAATSNAASQQAAATRIRNAHEAIAAAERTERQALVDLTSARRDAQNRLDDYVNSLKDAALSEEDAQLGVERALAHLRDTQADPRVSDLDRRQADLDYRSAVQHLADVKQSNKELQQEASDAFAKGVKNADQVVAAQQRVADSERNERNAKEELTAAQKAATAGATAGAAANTALAEAMDNLSPAGQRFARFVRAKLQPALKTIRFAAQDAILPGTQRALTTLLALTKPVTAVVTQTGHVLADLMQRAATLVTSPVWQKDIAKIGTNNAKAIGLLGQATITLLDPLRDILVVLGDGKNSLVQRFARWSLGLAESTRTSIAARRENGSLAAFFKKTGDRLAQWGRILHNIGTGLFNIGKQSAPAGQALTDSFEKATQRFVRWTEKDGPRIKRFFDDQVAVTESFGRILVGIARVLGRIMDNPKTRALMAEIENRLGPALGRLIDALASSGSGAKLGDILAKMADTITALVESGALGNLLDALNTMAGAFKAIAENPIGAYAIGGLLTLAGIAGPLGFVAGKLGKIAAAMGKIGKSKAGVKVLEGLLGSSGTGAAGAGAAGAAGAGATGVVGGATGGLLGRLGILRPGTGGGHRVGGPVAPRVGERTAARAAQRAGSLGGKVAKGARGGAVGIVGSIAGGLIGDAVDDKKGGVRSALGGAISGGATGAAIGATAGLIGGPLAPVTSTIGAAIGGGIGAIYGAVASSIGWGKVGSMLSKTAKSVFHSALSFLKDIPGEVGSFFAAIPGAIGRALSGAGAFVLGLFEDFVDFVTAPFRAILGSITDTPGFKAFQQSISDAKARIAAAFGRLWDAVTGAATDAMDFLNNGVVRPGLHVLEGIWHAALAVLTFAWHVLFDPLAAIASAALNAVMVVIGPLLAPIGALFRGIASVVQTLWSGLWIGLRVLAGAAIGLIVGLVTGFTGRVRAVFDGIVSAIRRIWKGGWNNLFLIASFAVNLISTYISTVLDGITTIFTDTIAAIKLVWNGLKAVARAPVDFVVNTVYNNGIRAVWNRVAGLIHAPELPELKFARGGVVPGYAPGRDTRLAMVSPGEGWLVPEAVRGLAAAMGTTATGAIDRINSAFTSRVPGDGNAPVPHLFGGGLIGFVKDRYHDARSAASAVGSTALDTAKAVASKVKGIALGALAAGASAAFKPVRSIVDSTLVGDSFPGLMRTGANNQMDRVVGFLRGKDQSFAKAAAKAAGGVGGAVGRWAPIVAQVLALLHQPASMLQWVLELMRHESGGNPQAINLTDINAKRGDPSRGLMQTIGATFSAYAGPYAKRGIYDPLANIFAGLNYGVHRYGSVAHIPGIAAMMSGRIYQPYDGGGILPPGLSHIVNNTGRPEHVFTGEQWSLLRRVVAAQVPALGLRPATPVGGRGALIGGDVNLAVPDAGTARTAIDMLDWALRDAANKGAYAHA